MKAVLLPALLALVACGTPQEQCISRNTKDLRTVEALIGETEQNLARGYGIERQSIVVPTLRPCWRPGRPTKNNPNPAPVMHYCDADMVQSYNKPVTLDLAAEATKLRQLRAKRAELAQLTGSVIRQCQALYPAT